MNTRYAKTSLSALVIALTVGISLPVAAETSTPAPEINNIDLPLWYGGLGVGVSNLEPDTNNSGYSLDDSRDMGWRLFLGYDYSDKLSFEGYYSDQGEVTLAPGGSISYQDFGAGALYRFIGSAYDRKGLDLFGKAGLGFMKNSSDIPYERLNDHHIYVGAGAAYALNDRYTLRADIDLYDKDSQFFTISIARYFGAASTKTSVYQMLSSEGEQLAVVVEPREPLLPPEEPSVDVKNADCLNAISNSALSTEGCVLTLENINFEFDSAALKSKAKNLLNDLAQKLSPSTKYKLNVSGHTDIIGTREYNLGLSKDRAHSVKGYLVDNGIDGSEIAVEAHGFDVPVADNSSSYGRAQNRRVEVEIIELVE